MHAQRMPGRRVEIPAYLEEATCAIQSKGKQAMQKNVGLKICVKVIRTG